MPDVAKFSIAMTLPGEASLGTFEAGAVSALIVALQRINEHSPDEVAVEIMTGASSGSLTAVLATAALLTGADAVAPLHQAWVSEPGLDALLGHELRAPLSLDRARAVAHRLLGEMLRNQDTPESRRQRGAVRLEFALTCLRGLNYEIPLSPLIDEDGSRRRPAARDSGAITATSYLDWARHQFGPGDIKGVTKNWLAAVESSIASASIPPVFPPMLLDRPRAEFERRVITNLPEPAANGKASERRIALWYSDGGLVDREPLGRCIRLARGRGWNEHTKEPGEAKPHVRDPGPRLVLLIRPHPEDGHDRRDKSWTGEADPPRWRATLARALRIVVAHSVSEDLRRVEKTNKRIGATEQLARELAGLLKDDGPTRSQLSRVVQRIREQAGSDGGVQKPLAEDVPALLRQALFAAAGLESKERVVVEIVAARSSSDVSGAAEGFLAERLRATDFLVGYDAMLRWMATGLQCHGVRSDWAKEAVAAARDRAATIPGWIGEIPLRRRPPLRVSAQLLRVGLRAARAGLANPRARG
jgi:predicted acylesterase/phospholipase RssA